MNTKRLCILFIISSISVQAQILNLKFPYFAGKTYEFKIFQGEKEVILREDTIQKGGKVQLVIPKEYKGYKGMALWLLTNSKTGGGLSFILNNENFSVECLDSVPSIKSIVYKDTRENIFDKENYQQQQQLFEKHDAVLAMKKAYSPNTELYKLSSKEYETLLKEYETYSKLLSSSDLYAAKFRQIVNLTMGIGSVITLDEKDKSMNINDFMVDKLDYEVLYTSNHWSGLIKNWVQLQTVVFKNDDKLITDITTILSRIKSNKVYTEYVATLTKELSKAGKDNVIEFLKIVVIASKKLQNFDGPLSVYQLDLSSKAPDLIICKSAANDAKTKTISVLKTDNLQSKYSLLFFYESGCGYCEDAIADLKKNYIKLTSKDLKIITLSADKDETVYTRTIGEFPWSDNYCDFEGIKGVNFKNYGVLGTPTMFLLDGKGIIIKKIALIKELVTWSETLNE
ncbi:peroxiredoxin family protein [Flavobacterium oncorhynchi]|uniref:peroxiredoxin family protein n=1 Tax=Flavobacterium oncorhynchi TaxID=728056 RepID=UPI00351A5E4D